MSDYRFATIKNLLSIWPRHVVMPVRWLSEQGFYPSLLDRYKKSNWITPAGRGAYTLANDTVGWKGAVFGLQKYYPERIHVGGISALELHGSAHFVRMSARTNIYLYSRTVEKLPSWASGQEWDQARLELVHTGFLDTELGLVAVKEGDFSITVSCRERAMLEMLYSANTSFSLVDCNLIMENLNTLRPDMVQSLLNECNSVKAARLFLFLAKRNGHKWFAELDLDRINLGSGDRQFAQNGVYDAEFKITYPKELFADDRVEF